MLQIRILCSQTTKLTFAKDHQDFAARDMRAPPTIIAEIEGGVQRNLNTGEYS